MSTSLTPLGKSKHPLDGARERLTRANENICNLLSEITPFISDLPVIRFSGENPTFTDEDRKNWDILTKANPQLPLRLSVLAGEIVHHMRAAFDHVAWQLSSPAQRTSNPTQIAFPVSVAVPPADKDELGRYKRQVKGISSPTALARIESLQPYKALNPLAHPLWVIHDLDRIDKHRELVLVARALTTNINIGLPTLVEQHAFETKPRRIVAVGDRSSMQVEGQISGGIALDKSLTGNGKDEPVVPFLENLLGFARNCIESFTGDI
jgi:hypothetical protein